MLLFCRSEGNKTEHKYCNFFFIVRVSNVFLLRFSLTWQEKMKSQAYFHLVKRFKLFAKATMHAFMCICNFEWQF